MVSEVEATLRINRALQARPSIKDVITIEPKVLEVLKLAAIQECRAERWQMYEILKYIASHYVGWDANQPALRSSDAYSMVMDALDIILPSPEIEDETLLDADREVVLQQLRDTVVRSFPQVKLPAIDENSVADNWLTLEEFVDKHGI